MAILSLQLDLFNYFCFLMQRGRSNFVFTEIAKPVFRQILDFDAKASEMVPSLGALFSLAKYHDFFWENAFLLFR